MAGIVVGAAAIAATATLAVGVIQNETQKKANNAAIANMKEDQRLKLLSSTQKAALDYRIANAQDDVAKLAIYEQTLASISGSTLSSVGSIYAAGVASKSKQNYLQKSVFIAGGFLLLGGAYYQLKKK
jgi:methylthioribose-1-phosphate isomerase